MSPRDANQFRRVIIVEFTRDVEFFVEYLDFARDFVGCNDEKKHDFKIDRNNERMELLRRPALRLKKKKNQ